MEFKQGYRIGMLDLLKEANIVIEVGCHKCANISKRELYKFANTEFILCRGCMLDMIDMDGPLAITPLNAHIEKIRASWEKEE